MNLQNRIPQPTRKTNIEKNAQKVAIENKYVLEEFDVLN